MPGLFPFVGRRIGLICNDSARYEGRLIDVNSATRAVTITNAVHFGTEGRLSNPKEIITPRGTMPPEMRLTFPDKYVKCYVLAAECRRRSPIDTTPPPPEVIIISDDDDEGHHPPGVEPVASPAEPVASPAEPAAEEPPPLTRVVEETPRTKAKALDYSELKRIMGLIGDGDSSTESRQRPSSSSSAYTVGRSPSARVVEALQISSSASTIDSRSPLIVNSSSLFPLPPLNSTAAPVGLGRTGDYSVPNGSLSSTSTAVSTPSTSASSPSSPLYFIAQIRPPWAIGVLLNPDACPKAPTYIRFDATRLRTSNAKEVTLSQVWRVTGYIWCEGWTRRRLVDYNFRSLTDVLEVVVQKRGGTPWLIHDLISHQADVGHTLNGGATAELVADVVRVRQEGRLVQIICGAGMDTISYLVIETPRCGFVRLGPLQRGRKDEIHELAHLHERMHISAETIQLPVGCRIGRTFVLPAGITYDSEKGPFEPGPGDLVGVSRHGEFFMC